ncbi:dihydrolipoyllysine-residue acetyltransferase component 2 of pyruvate dehydrogenase complex, mitochondrial-like isoform X2 [Phragmites australis]|uniref:dihydrolipoyllysine-residue acetyltransferase component 2 of pyruvate dehydrogenase complex, mitochondrial-like isoform X2 n=1 Tax=Phragmites australis TaxID=29695 RepID=UPI002D7689A8|nr:dihydrolipoyllysine-residue acetyltransferase component 2 of pyruvate dehydrogenase complex, mitochondrial-like isoform X2 [Phragmites australis]
MSAAQLLRHSRKLRSLHNAIDCERSTLVRHFSSGSGSFLVKENGVGKRTGGTSFSQYNQPEKELETFKVSLGVNRSYTWRRAPSSSVLNSIGGLNGSFLSGKVASARSFSSSTDLPPHQEIGMPSLSPTMTEGNIAKWLKKEGDKVSPGEVLCEVETDKATVEMECMEEGYLAKIILGDGAKEIKVGEIIAITVEEEGDIEKFKDYKPSSSAEPAAPAESKAQPEPSQPKVEEKEPTKAPESKAPKTEETSQSGDRIFASPLARKLAEDNNVPLSSVKGSGPDGRILKADIEDYLASVAKGGKMEALAAPGLSYVDIPNAQIRKVTANRLLASKQTIPHYYLTVDTRVDKLIKLRAELNPLQDASGGKKISINDLVIKAAALALQKVPQCNSSWMNDFIRQYHNVNINVAVQTEHGLFVPVIRDADKKGLGTIAEEVKQLAQKARENSLKPAEYEGGTFTVSNLGGPFGIKQFCAIINPPQSAILAIGSAEKRVIPGGADAQYEFGSFMSATLSCDHRVIDGAIGAEFLKAFKGYIENPTSMLL